MDAKTFNFCEQLARYVLPPDTSVPVIKEIIMKRAVGMLEPMMASLLTLDWEITSQSIRKFERELEVLKGKLSGDPHSKRLIELSLPICNYLRVRKGAASPASMQFLKEATRTLHFFWQKRKLAVSERKKALKKLVDKYDKLIADVQRVNAALAQATRAKPAKATAPRVAKAAPKAKPKKKTPAKKVAVRKVPKPSPTALVLKAIKSHRKGIDIATLKKTTGLADSSIRSILYRASKEGKIKRIGRGVYVSA